MPNNNSPLVEVILCSHNGASYIDEQLNSLVNQSYGNLQISIYDDSSSDNTCNIIKQYQAKQNNISLSINRQKLGFVKNFEQALAKSSADYIAFCDQDDIWHHHKLANQMRAMASLDQSHPAMVHSDLKPIDKNGKPLCDSYFKRQNYFFPRHKSVARLISAGGVMGNTMLINKSLAKLVLPFAPGIDYHDSWISIINELFGQRITLSQPLVHYRIHNTNTSNDVGSFHETYNLLTEIKKKPWRGVYTNRIHLLQQIRQQFSLNEADGECINAYLAVMLPKKNLFKLLRMERNYKFFRYYNKRYTLSLLMVLRFWLFKFRLLK